MRWIRATTVIVVMAAIAGSSIVGQGREQPRDQFFAGTGSDLFGFSRLGQFSEGDRVIPSSSTIPAVGGDSSSDDSAETLGAAPVPGGLDGAAEEPIEDPVPATSTTTVTTAPSPTTTVPAPGTTVVPPTTTTVPASTTTSAPATTTTTTTSAAAAEAGSRVLVIDEDTMIMNETMVLRPGDRVEFRNGARLMFGEGASADWQGTPTSTWSGDGRSQNLERDIEITGSGDIMFMTGSKPSVIRFVEIDLQPRRATGHYPLHWHFVGDGSRGTLVEGVVVKNSTNRAFVPHASHGITFKDTIAKNVAGSAYWWDPPAFQSEDRSNNSNDIVYERALADGVTNAVGDNRGFRLSAFELGAGSGNIVRNSVARNIRPSHRGDCAGFGWPEITHRQPRVWTFRNNATYGSACHGIFVWQNAGKVHLVDGFRGDRISHGAYSNSYQYRNVDVPEIIVHAVDWSVTGGRAPLVTVVRNNFEGTVTFADVDIDRVVIQNAENGGDKPIHLVFDGTGLACSAVDWSRAVEGTTVAIDGQACSP